MFLKQWLVEGSDRKVVFWYYAKRFWSKARKGPGGCWLWSGGKSSRGYGYFNMRSLGSNISIGAHRVAWELVNGPIPAGLFVCHKCDTPLCVNPAHLFLGTLRDNVTDMVRKGRQARGLRHGSVTKPGAQPRGDQHWTHIRPENLARGEQHWMHNKPERIARGDRNGMAKLTELKVLQIRADYRPGSFGYSKLAKKYGVTKALIRDVVKRRIWTHI